jgi:hypothetical protein
MIAVAIAFGLIDGCPLPTRDHTPAWERGFVEPLREVRDVVETPVAWIRRTLRVTQQWALYQSPSPARFRMWIEGQTREAWQLVYRAGDADHAEDAALIEHARVWGTWDPTDAPPAEYAAFSAWITARVLERHPDFVAVRVRMEAIAIEQGTYTPSGTFQWTRVGGRR